MNGVHEFAARPWVLNDDLSPSAVEAFLEVKGWRRVEKRDELLSIWESAVHDASVMVPYKVSYRDFSARLKDALYTIADVYNIKSREELTLEIVSARSDILLLRADQDNTDGSIPLQEALDLLAGVKLMLTAAACSAIRPRPTIPRRRPSAVTNFMANEVRMGHTMRGSFVLTVFARHEQLRAEEPSDPTRAIQSGDESTSHIAEALEGMPPRLTLPPTAAHTPPDSYTRSVMTTLASGLEAACELLADDPQVDLDDAVERGASAELIKSLGKMTTYPGLRALDMSFRWSPIGPRPDVSSRVTIPRPNRQRIESVSDVLHSRPVIDQDDILGQVVRLEREGNQYEGIVVVDSYLGKTRRRIKMRLSGQSYMTALQAHKDRLPILATGTVTLDKGTLWLTGSISVQIPSEGSTA